jgi:hypothetical protein
MPVLFAGLHEGRKLVHVQPLVAIGVELDRLAADEEERGIIAITNRLPQVRESLAQALAGFFLGLIGPQETGQRVSAMGMVGLDC